MNHWKKSTTVSSLYLHVPYCRSLCNYCDFFRTPLRDDSYDCFENYLEKSLDAHFQLMNNCNVHLGNMETIYFGGGTPFLWGNRGVDFVKHFFDKLGLKFASNCEFTLELNPGSFDPQLLDRWTSIGVNRFSLGVQSYNDRFLSFLGRSHRTAEVDETLAFLQKKDFEYSVDLMLGLPYSLEYERDVLSELKRLLSFNPGHVSVYILTPKNGYELVDKLPSDEFVRDEYLKVSEFLVSNSFEHYEVSNFALHGRLSRHNLKYWNEQSVLAFGPSATGLIVEEGGDATRYVWDKGEAQYVVEKLSKKEILFEKFYLKLRTNLGLTPEEFFDEADCMEFNKLVQEWSDRELLVSSGPVVLNAAGYIVMDSLMDEVFGRISNL